MWGRVIEIMLGLWLVVSPFVWGHYPADAGLWRSDLISGATIIGLAMLSFWQFRALSFLRYAHLAIIPVALWVVGFGYIYGGHPAAAGAQNDILTGLTLLFIAIIPNDAAQPPRAWRQLSQEG